ncbi:MAG: triphosphoribosyl-dephospho-CoA synthase, partial [Paraburkholderia sp.]|uniref:triphosphoribosyl-dephospho-CoA synthase n=1 Tax=Paraburkholderia sp. TaxID=1926495 RepID=UPI00397E65BC
MATPALVPFMATRGSSASVSALAQTPPGDTSKEVRSAHAVESWRESGADDAWLAQLAVTALIEEAQLTPKPALVDRRGSGSHRDLDLATMLRSAHALEATFVALARAARRSAPSATLRAELAQIGRAGVHEMMRA